MDNLIDFEYFQMRKAFREERKALGEGWFRWPDDEAPNAHEDNHEFRFIDGLLMARGIG